MWRRTAKRAAGPPALWRSAQSAAEPAQRGADPNPPAPPRRDGRAPASRGSARSASWNDPTMVGTTTAKLSTGRRAERKVGDAIIDKSRPQRVLREAPRNIEREKI